MRKYLYPGLALLLIIVTVAQVKAMRSARGGVPPQQAAAAAQKETFKVVAEGRLVAYPGAEVTVGSDVAGTLESLAVVEKDRVRKGQTIAIVKADDLRAALGEARARVGEAEADIRLYESEVARAKSLFHEDVGSRQAWEKAERDLDAARARRASAVAEVRRLDAVLAKTVITAPIDGVVITRHVHAGESVESGAPLLTIANLDKTRVEAEIDEYDAARVRLGGEASIAAEGYEESWPGTIEEIPDAVVNRRLKPQDPSKPIDTRVLLVKIAFDEKTPLKLGQRVEVRIR
ncbi:MAG TPA: efflux RND transporter periplasmic adaptor subunit [Thermoanaerobaculia bacterium]